MDVSICTACMNREELLIQALETWINIPVKEIIIVDWSSLNPLKSILAKFQDPRIKILEVLGKQYYNQSKASNLKVRASSGNTILSIDCDIKLSTDFFETHSMDEKVFYHGDVRKHPGTTGTCLMSRKMFLESNGYNEFMNGWGYHDLDFYKRLVSIGFEEKYIQDTSIQHIEHEESSRVINYEMKNKLFSNIENKKIAKKNNWTPANKMENQSISIFTLDGMYSTIM